MSMEARAQLEDELAAIATSLAALVGVDLCDILATRARQAAPRLVAELADGALADEVAADILTVLWPRGEPDLEWWGTPLGLLIAPSAAAAFGEDGWTHGEAARVLGVARGTVAQLVARGDLVRTPGGGCGRASVLARLVRLARTRAVGA